jgi:hypothetical protein
MPIPDAPDAYHIEVLYDDILSMKLGGELNGSTDSTPATFAHINKRPLTFNNPFRPFRQVLLLIAFSAFKRALDNTKRAYTLATAAAPGDSAAWRALFEEAAPPVADNSFIMQRFLKG